MSGITVWTFICEDLRYLREVNREISSTISDMPEAKGKKHILESEIIQDPIRQE